MTNSKYIILFDGQCNLCNYWARYIIKRDKKDIFRFSSLQSEVGETLKKKHNINPTTDAIILIENEQHFTKSTAALRILKLIGGINSIFYSLTIFPVFIRDFVYDIIAKYRYQWFGKTDCEFIPTPDIEKKFLM
ncbi:MAG: thiol-disulfide oxidoreductase DCC family protein [Vicingus serpentipes]|nr:thiol-disulfide oxidoreductase DCC family protein [Vicingus serpentipes]